MEHIKFNFAGRLADNHELNFYEAGRFQYAAARFIYTLERFRQDKKIVGRLSSKVDIDIRIKAPERGSFLQDVFIHAAPVIYNCAIQVPIEAMMAYAWHKLFPTNNSDSELVVDIAKINHAVEQERTEQERQRTQQVQLMAEVANNNSATAQQALDILKSTLENRIEPFVNNRHVSTDELKAAHARTLAEMEREEVVSEFADEFAKIDQQTGDLLCGQLRKAVPDMVYPLRSSANNLHISGGASQKAIAELDYETGKAIGDYTLDENLTTRRGKLISYDREQTTGKFRYHSLSNPIPYKIPVEARTSVIPKIIQALNMDTILTSIQFIRDPYGNPKSILLWDLFPEEGEE